MGRRLDDYIDPKKYLIIINTTKGKETKKRRIPNRNKIFVEEGHYPLATVASMKRVMILVCTTTHAHEANLIVIGNHTHV